MWGRMACCAAVVYRRLPWPASARPIAPYDRGISEYRIVMLMRLVFIFLCSSAMMPLPFLAGADQKWVTSWTASMHGPYPVGNPSAQPDLRLVFPTPANGARDQTFRLIVQPDLWGRQARLRFSNAFGTRPVTFDGVFIGLQM